MARIWVRSYIRQDGTRVRAHTRGAPGRLAASGVAVAISVSIVADLGGSGSLAVRTPAERARLSSNSARAQVRVDRAKVRLARRGYKAELRFQQDTDCESHSYGEVQDFFHTTPCTSVERAYLELRDKRKNVVLVAISRVDMPDAGQARRYKTLVDRSGTGNVTELSREVGRFRKVRYDALVYGSGMDGPTSVWNVQVQPVGWLPGVKVLDAIRAVAAGG